MPGCTCGDGCYYEVVKTGEFPNGVLACYLCEVHGGLDGQGWKPVE